MTADDHINGIVERFDDRLEDLTSAVRAIAHGGATTPTGLEAVSMSLDGAGGAPGRDGGIAGALRSIASALESVAESIGDLGDAVRQTKAQP